MNTSAICRQAEADGGDLYSLDTGALAGQTSRVSIAAGAVAVLHAIATVEGVSPRQLLEALIHYAGSCHQRPGSWEAPGFDLTNYVGPEALADRWFV